MFLYINEWFLPSPFLEHVKNKFKRQRTLCVCDVTIVVSSLSASWHSYIWPAGGAKVNLCDYLNWFSSLSRESKNDESSQEEINHQEAYEKHFYFDN